MAAADADAFCLSQKPTGAGNLTLNGVLASSEMDMSVRPSVARTVGNPDVYRRVAIASSGNETGKTFTLTGIDSSGKEFTESIAGPNATATTSLNSVTKIISIAVDAATVGNITVGTNSTADLPPIPLTYYSPAFEAILQAQFSAGASLTWQWQSSASDPYDGTRDSDKFWTSEGSALTASGVAEVNEAPLTMVRATITSFVSGYVNWSILKTV